MVSSVFPEPYREPTKNIFLLTKTINALAINAHPILLRKRKIINLLLILDNLNTEQLHSVQICISPFPSALYPLFFSFIILLWFIFLLLFILHFFSFCSLSFSPSALYPLYINMFSVPNQVFLLAVFLFLL